MKYLYERMREHLEIIGTTKVPDMNEEQQNATQRILEISRTIVGKGLLKTDK